MENVIQLKEILLDYINTKLFPHHEMSDLIFIDNLTSYTVYYWNTNSSDHKTVIIKKDDLVIHYYTKYIIEKTN